MGLDPSLTSTGVAILRNGRPFRPPGAPSPLKAIGDDRPARTYDEQSDRIGRQYKRIRDEIIKWSEHVQIDLVVIEGIPHGLNLPSTSERSGLWWDLHRLLRSRRIPIAIIYPTTLKLWATGNGKADKAAMKTTVRGWWPHARDFITCDDIADAAALALAGAFQLGDPMPFEVRPVHTERLKAAKWPSNFGPTPETMQVGAVR